MSYDTRAWLHAQERKPKLERVASECDLYGHDYHVREDFSNPARWDENGRLLHDRTPDEVFCGRCGKSWKVER